MVDHKNGPEKAANHRQGAPSEPGARGSLSITGRRPQVAARNGAGHRAAAARLSALLLLALTACEAREDDAERFRERCEQFFACDCVNYGFPDLDACMQAEAVQRAGWLAEFEAVGLTPDIACMDRAQGPDPEMCLTQAEYEVLHPFDFSSDRTVCGVCSFASGDRQAGEPCLDINGYGYASDCAPGLICVGPRTIGGVCIDPCVPTTVGLPCDRGVNACAEGLHCNIDQVCTPMAGPGESCANNLCADGHTCDEEQDRCVPLAGSGESCLEIYCDWGQGLVCGQDDVCGPVPHLGEPCRWSCADDLICYPGTEVCAPRGQAGERCDDVRQCATGLYCEELFCRPERGPGEPCEASIPCQLGLSCIEGICGPGQGLYCDPY